MEDCVASIDCPVDGIVINNIHILSSRASSISLPSCVNLQLLAIVSTSQIPLQLALGPSLDTWTPDAHTEEFFSNVLLSSESSRKANKSTRSNAAKEWWGRPNGQSTKGVLVDVPPNKPEAWRGPMITEILFYGVVEEQQLRLRALPLSSELLYQPEGETSPLYSPHERPGDGTVIDAQFLPSPWEDDASFISSAKRKKMNDVFQQASERGRNARRKGGESIAAAAAAMSADTVNGHRRSISWDQRKLHAELQEAGQFLPQVPVITRPPSRSPSIASDVRPISRKGASDAKRSTLSRMTTADDADGEPSTEVKNKEALSRLVMAGMRLYGMQQSKHGRARKSSAAPSFAEGIAEMEANAAEVAAKDEEYKVVFHQAYRGACVAFRNHIATQPLHLHPDRLRETVDKILAILCTDPLLHPLSDSHATEIAITPAGRAEKHGGMNISFSGGPSEILTPDMASRLGVSTLEVRRSPLATKSSLE